MTIVSGIGIVNLVLALTAGLISIGIFRRVSGRLATSWRYLLIAFLVLGVAEILGTIDGSFQVFGLSKGLVSLLFQSGHFVFVVLAFVGLWYQFGLLKRLTGEEES